MCAHPISDLCDCSSSVPGAGAKGNQRRMEELQSKVMRQADELVEMHRKRGEIQTQLAELTSQLRKKDDDLAKKDERFVSSSACPAFNLLSCVLGQEN